MPKTQKEMNSELMLTIYRNLQTAKQAINNVVDKTNDSNLKRELKAQFKDYDDLTETCEDLAKIFEIELVDNNIFKKAKMWVNVNMALLMDKSNCKIACVNIIGSTIGILDLMKVLRDSKKCKKELINLAKAIINLEERNIEKLKPYVLESTKQEENKDENNSENEEENNDESNENDNVLKEEKAPKTKKANTKTRAKKE